MRKKLLLTFVFVLAVMNGWAQGDNVGMGGRDEGYQAALQWIPDLSQDARLSLAYVGKTTHYNDAIGLPDYHSNRVELSLIYRIKIF